MDDFDDLDDIVREIADGNMNRSAILTDESDIAVVDNDLGINEIRNLLQPRGYRDPMQAEFDRLNQAAERAGVKDELYQLLEARLAKGREDSAEAGFVGNPPSAARQVLGGSQILTSSIEIVSKSLCRYEGKDSETLPVVVTLAPSPQIGVNGTNVIRPFAYIRWGTYGMNWTAEVDFGTGRQFVVNASTVEVEGALEALSAANGQQINLGANLSFHAPMRTSPLIRTRYLDSCVQNVARDVAVPPFASGLLPVQMADSSTPGSLTLDFKDSAGTTRYSLVVPNGSQTASIPLTGDIVRVTVTSTAATTQHVRLPFELAL